MNKKKLLFNSYSWEGSDLSLVNIAELKTYLSYHGINTGIDDNQLEILTQIELKKLASLIDVDIIPVERTETMIINDNKLLLSHYPIKSVESIKIDNHTLDISDYTFDNKGIIYFTNNYNLIGKVTINYTTGLPDSVIESKIIPILFDSFVYEFDSNPNKNATSISEGKSSISYDANHSLKNSINSRIAQLKNSYSARIRLF